uniref:Multidrug and toxin extrusion protein n=1 Tax=Labrus bergylta TaxID=56723 RepID=A0A3Q3N3A5_9LABR
SSFSSPGITLIAGSSDKLFCCRWVRSWIPLTHREELYHILRMTGPLLLSRILNYLLPFVVTMFCGRLGNEVMAGYGLASATINVTTAATGGGLGLACDTLVSQTFGGKNLLRVGVILQRGIIILLLFCLPCWGLLINAQSILLCMGQEPEVARIAQLYMTRSLICTYCTLLCLCCQGIIMPQLYTAALANIANLVTNYIFLYWLDLGVSGSAAANTLSQIYICALLYAYIRWKKLHVKTWGGWSVESLQEWGSYMKLAIPSTLMTCFEWWVYEFGGFFAGMLSEDELAAQHAVIMIAFITYMVLVKIPLGIQAAACARVGNALGAGDTARAILTTKLSLTLAASFAVVEGVVLGSTKTWIGFIFTSDEKIVGLVSHLMNAYCFLQLFDGLCVCTGIFLGTGKQKIPAVANFIGYYCIGLSLSNCFWLGLLICVVLQSTFYIIVIFKLNWKRMTEEVISNNSPDGASSNGKVSGLLFFTLTTQMAFHRLFDTGINVPVKSVIGNICMFFQSEDGYMYVSAQEHGNMGSQVGHVVQQLKGGHISTTQLILRRGLTMFAAVALLAVGACVHFLVPLPETPFTGGNSTLDLINATFIPDQMISTVLVSIQE